MPDFTRDAENIASSKVALRTRLIAKRKARSPEALRAAALQTQQTLAAAIHDRSPRVIAAYVPVGTEPGGPELPEIVRHSVASASPPLLLLPLLLPDGDLDWAAYDGPRSLHPGPRGLLEPAGRRLGSDAVAEATFVVVPALAVDRSGVRMGKGGGSYDRALARLSPGAFTVALLHDGELLDTVPAEAHDQRVRAVVTPGEGLSRFPDWTK
jgi:5-formyltetrahydrofolate cyclo-ligase